MEKSGVVVCGVCGDLRCINPKNCEDTMNQQVPKSLMKTDVEAVLAQRGAKYGAVQQQAAIGEGMITAMEASTNWQGLQPYKKYALRQIAYKISRLLEGDHNDVDTWKDLEGYAKLTRNNLPGADNDGA